MSENSEKSISSGQKGRLVVETYSGSRAKPIEGAHVIVSRENAEGEELLRTLVTDSGGRTETIELDAPAAENSFTHTGSMPYSNYNIRIDKEGYYTVEDLNVPVFPGITAIQPVPMVPLPFGAKNGKTKFIVESEPENLQPSPRQTGGE